MPWRVQDQYGEYHEFETYQEAREFQKLVWDILKGRRELGLDTSDKAA